MASKPKPALSEWLIAHRKEHGESVADIARVTDRSEATVRGWEAGRPPQPDDPVIAHLERHWGAIAPREAGAGDQTALVTALAAQTAALTALVDELRLWRSEDRKRLSRVEAVVDRLVVGALGGPDTPVAGAPRVPDGTAV
jgi:hypothetical protein